MLMVDIPVPADEAQAAVDHGEIAVLQLAQAMPIRDVFLGQEQGVVVRHAVAGALAAEDEPSLETAGTGDVRVQADPIKVQQVDGAVHNCIFVQYSTPCKRPWCGRLHPQCTRVHSVKGLDVAV